MLFLVRSDCCDIENNNNKDVGGVSVMSIISTIIIMLLLTFIVAEIFSEELFVFVIIAVNVSFLILVFMN